MANEHTGVVRFEDFELDVRAGELRRRGQAVPLPPQQFTVLVTLAQAAGSLVTRDQLRERLWGNDAFVDFDAGLNFCIRQLRLALGDSAAQSRFIQTVPRRGYRFIAPITAVPPVEATPAVAATPTRRQHARLAAAAALVLAAGIGLGSYVGVRAAPAVVTPEARIADAHAARGFVALNDEWAWPAAERAFMRALQLDARHEVALISLSRLHASQGRFEASLTFARRAVDAHPTSSRALATLGLALLFSGDAAGARAVCTEALDRLPESRTARMCVLHAHAEVGGDHSQTWPRVLARFETRTEPGVWFHRATVEARAGRSTAAIESLARALDAREPDASFALVHPAFAAIRQDAAFQRVTAAAGLFLAP
jgi:DNA-binding winged helix-turn-helix (wHTH) protein